MTQLYNEYHDQGVEFIGVSLDLPEEDGGLEALKAFVAERKIPWPQYYQGHDNLIASDARSTDERFFRIVGDQLSSPLSSSSTRRANSTRARPEASSTR